MPRVRAIPKLKEYKAKRHFDRTAEPGPKVSRSRSGRLFVVQKHDASRLHYDFRLEHNGVLKSWAVPKGPSLDPSEKTLAVEVEDHPVDYGSFEGVIPEGEYGGGTVLLWDKGTWTPVGDPDEGLRTGKLKFDLQGQKLRGRWMLVRMHGRKGDEDKRNWLLFKERDAESHSRAEGDVREDKPLSVATGRDLDEIARDRDRVWGSNRKSPNPRAGSLPHGQRRKRRGTPAKTAARGAIDVANEPGAREATMEDDPAPELATLVDEPPAGNEWLHEIKFDGYRILCVLTHGKAQLLSRNANDWTPRFRSIARAAEALPVGSAIIDGEVVVLGSSGRTDFQSLQNLLKGLAPRARLLYFAFDLLYLDGFDLRQVPLIRRKALLRQVLRGLGKDSELRYSEHIEGRGRDVFDEACRNHLEGIVSKRSDSRYIARRTKDWLKCKCESRQEFVIGGYTEPSGSRAQFGALLLGYFDHGALVYCGKVGTGFNAKSLRSIRAAMKPHEVSEPAFTNPPTGSEARGVHWLSPAMVGEVQFSEWTRDGTLRHPSFQGLREDKKASEVVREIPKHTPSENGSRTSTHNGRHPKRSAPAKNGDSQVAGVQLSNPGRVLYPEQNITKLELATYYESIADWVLPHMIKRPLTLVRCPQGRQATCFYQKHLTERMPTSVHGVTIQEKDGKEEEYVAIDNLQGLLGLVQLGVLEFHPWGCRDDKVDRPDRLVIDLDPGPGVEWGRVAAAALLIRDRLEHAGLRSFLKTTGGKGLHVLIPIERRTSWDDAKAFTKLIADGIVRDYPDQFTTNMSKSKRPNKIFVDYLRNGRGATAIAPYSTRARENATVATPLAWEELTEDLRPAQFTVRTIPGRLAALKHDPWAQISHTRQAITAAMLTKGR